VASGRAKQLGIESRCTGEDVHLVDTVEQHAAACHLVPLDELP
jgi:hypothetical protein